MMKLMQIKIIILFSLLIARVVFADLLNLTTYPEGTFVPYGDLMQIAVEQTNQLKFLKGTTTDPKGKIIVPLNLTGDVMVSFRLYAPSQPTCCSENLTLALFSEENVIKVKLSGNYDNGFIGTELHSSSYDKSNAWFQANTNKVTLTISGDQAKLYINGVFACKTTLKYSNLIYTKMVLSGFRDKDALYELSSSGTPGVLYPIQPKFINLSTRGLVGSAPEQYMYGGFIVYGGNRKIYIRGIGQGLRSVGLNTNLDPSIRITMPGNNSFQLANNNWQDDSSALEIQNLPAGAYAYSPPPASVDAAMIRCFAPGAYVVTVMPNNMTDIGIVTIDDLGAC